MRLSAYHTRHRLRLAGIGRVSIIVFPAFGLVLSGVGDMEVGENS